MTRRLARLNHAGRGAWVIQSHHQRHLSTHETPPCLCLVELFPMPVFYAGAFIALAGSAYQIGAGAELGLTPA